MYALIDCNNFFVSCERLLDKTLENQPVVVLSNNDGCIISRSQEAKDLGIKMGAPLFEVMDVIGVHNVRYFSPKFEFYNFKSQQIIAEIESAVAECEVYSIDEVFFSLHGYSRFYNIEKICRNLADIILEKQKIPTSVGVAPTKTLAKVANRIVKKYPQKFGNYYCIEKDKIPGILQWLPVEDIWGIGRRLAARMHDHGIYKASQLLEFPETWIRKQMGINGIRLVNELRGIPQLDLDEPAKKKSIATTRSFITQISEKSDLHERVASFTLACAEKLRRQNSCCKVITVFIRTNRFRQDENSHSESISYTFPNPTSSSLIMATTTRALLEKIYKTGSAYKKAGVLVSDFVPDNERQTSLFCEDMEHHHVPIMQVMDRLNRKYGKEKIHLASSSSKPNYERKLLNPEYEKFLKSNTWNDQSFRFH